MNPHVLELRELTKCYGPCTAVDGLNFHVDAGEIMGIVGPHGAGKTATMRLLMGFIAPTRGRALVEGLDCFWRRREVTKRVGYVPEDPVFPVHLTGIDVLRLSGTLHGLDERTLERRLLPLLERLGLLALASGLVRDYDFGAKKALALGCALLPHPKVLLLDEPTRGLNAIAAQNLPDLLRDHAARGAAVLLTSQLMVQVREGCHRWAVLHRGRLSLSTLAPESRSSAPSTSTIEDSIAGWFEGHLRKASPSYP